MSARESKSTKLPRRASEAVPLINASPLIATTFAWQMKPPQDCRVVVVKGTFSIAPDGPAVVASEQDMPSGDRYFDDNLEGSLCYPSDLAIFKPKADVVAIGHAYWKKTSADGQKTRSGVGYAEFDFGPFKRSIAVFGDRAWDHAGSPAPFERMPLQYERAFGGVFSDANPVGRGHKTGVVMPNLEDPRALVRSPKDSPTPACFGPVSPTWRARRQKIGTYDGRWAKTNWPYFAADLDWTYFQAAPPEQQIPYLKGDEKFVLGGMHPDHPIIHGRLPNMRPRVFVQRTPEAGGDFLEVILRNDTAWFDVDAMKLVLVWRGVFDSQDDESSEVAQIFVLADEVAPKHTLEAARARFAAELALKQPQQAPLNSGPANGPRASALAGIAPLGTQPLPASPAGRTREDVLADALKRGSFAGQDLSGIDLTDADFSGRDFRGAILKGAMLRGARFDGANLEEAVLVGSDATAASFKGANLNQADFTGATLVKATFSQATIQRAVFASCLADDAHFEEAEGEGANFALASLNRAQFEKASLKAIDFTGGQIDHAQFSKASIAEARFYECKGEGVKFDGTQMENARCDNASIPGASFIGANAKGSQWLNANLTKANFQNAHLEGANLGRVLAADANFNKVSAQEARFKKATLTGATFLKANLMRASFESAELTRADLRGSNLYEAEVWKAKIENARFDAAILHGTKLAL